MIIFLMDMLISLDISLPTDMMANLIKINLHDANTIHFITLETQMAQLSRREKEVISDLDKRAEKRSVCSLEVKGKIIIIIIIIY